MNDGEFPLADIEVSVNDDKLQKEHEVEDLDDMQRARLDKAQSGVSGLTQAAKWYYFRSPSWTWQNLCGREGWILYDRKLQKQYAFLITVMN